MASINLLLAQVKPAAGDLMANADRISEVLERYSHADLVVFPELFLSSYSVFHRTEASGGPFLTRGHPCLRKLEDACATAGSWLVVGTPFGEDGDGEVPAFNSALFFAPSGFVGTHHKTALPTGRIGKDEFREALHFGPGASLTVFKTPLLTFGIVICYELFFPEIARSLALNGAQLLICLSAAPEGQRAAFDAVLPARAVENSSYVAFANLPREGGVEFFGGSCLVSPSGRVVERAKEGEEELLLVELDPDRIARIRASYDNLEQAPRIRNIARRVISS